LREVAGEVGNIEEVSITGNRERIRREDDTQGKVSLPFDVLNWVIDRPVCSLEY